MILFMIDQSCYPPDEILESENWKKVVYMGGEFKSLPLGVYGHTVSHSGSVHALRPHISFMVNFVVNQHRTHFKCLKILNVLTPTEVFFVL